MELLFMYSCWLLLAISITYQRDLSWRWLIMIVFQRFLATSELRPRKSMISLTLPESPAVYHFFILRCAVYQIRQLPSVDLLTYKLSVCGLSTASARTMAVSSISEVQRSLRFVQLTFSSPVIRSLCCDV